MSEIVATKVIASQPAERQLTFYPALDQNCHTFSLPWVYIIILLPCTGCDFSYFSKATDIVHREKHIGSQDRQKEVKITTKAG